MLLDNLAFYKDEISRFARNDMLFYLSSRTVGPALSDRSVTSVPLDGRDLPENVIMTFPGINTRKRTHSVSRHKYRHAAPRSPTVEMTKS